MASTACYALPSASVNQVIRIKRKEARVFPPQDPLLCAILINSRIISCKHNDILAVRLGVRRRARTLWCANFPGGFSPCARRQIYRVIIFTLFVSPLPVAALQRRENGVNIFAWASLLMRHHERANGNSVFPVVFADDLYRSLLSSLSLLTESAAAANRDIASGELNICFYHNAKRIPLRTMRLLWRGRKKEKPYIHVAFFPSV